MDQVKDTERQEEKQDIEVENFKIEGGTEEPKNKEYEKEVEDTVYKTMTEALIIRPDIINNNPVYMPLSGKELIKKAYELIDKEYSEDEAVKFQNKLKEITESMLIEKIKEINGKIHSIPDVISFSVHQTIYFVHRVRMIQSFVALVKMERASLKNRIVSIWLSDVNNIPPKRLLGDFETQIVNDHTSEEFRMFHQKIVNIFGSLSPGNKKPFDSEYYLSRFFFGELDGIKYSNKVTDLVYQNHEFGRKKAILKDFFNLLFNAQYQKKELSEILNISFIDLRRAALKRANIGSLNLFFRSIIDMLRSLVSFLDTNRSYLREVSKTYANISEKFASKVKDEKNVMQKSEDTI